MGKKPQSRETRRVTLDLTSDLYRQLRIALAERGETWQEVGRRLVADYLKAIGKKGGRG